MRAGTGCGACDTSTSSEAIALHALFSNTRVEQQSEK